MTTSRTARPRPLQLEGLEPRTLLAAARRRSTGLKLDRPATDQALAKWRELPALAEFSLLER